MNVWWINVDDLTFASGELLFGPMNSRYCQQYAVAVIQLQYNCDLIVFGLEDSTHNVAGCLAISSSFQLNDAQGTFSVRAL